MIGPETAVELLAPPSLGRYWVSGAGTLLRVKPKRVWGMWGFLSLLGDRCLSVDVRN